MKFLVNDIFEEREIDYTITRKEYVSGDLIERKIDYPVIKSNEYIYENALDVKVYEIGWGTSSFSE